MRERAWGQDSRSLKPFELYGSPKLTSLEVLAKLGQYDAVEA